MFGAAQYTKARAVREHYQARLAKLEYEEKVASLISKDEVQVATFRSPPAHLLAGAPAARIAPCAAAALPGHNPLRRCSLHGSRALPSVDSQISLAVCRCFFAYAGV